MFQKNIWLGLVVVLAFTFTVIAQPSNKLINNSKQNTSLTKSMSSSVSDVYDYPVKPGMKEWEALETHDEMLKVTQIPNKILRSMKTEALLESVLNYPLLMDRIAFNSKQQGFDSVAEKFNGFAELKSRSDVGSTVLSKYEKMDVNITESMTLEEQGNLSYRLEFFETLLAQDFVLDNLTEAQKNELFAELLRKYELKEKNAEVYGFNGKESTAFCLGRLLFKLESNFVSMLESDESLKNFIQESSPANPDTIDWIIDEAQKSSNGLTSSFLDKVIAFDNFNATVRTPKGTAVTVIGGRVELTTAQKTACKNDISARYPQAVQETECTNIYNCHSYAWYSQSTSNPYWMNSPGDDAYWLDRSYVGSYAVGAANRKVSYASTDHSAITIDAIYFRSKWGSGPRMKHKYNYCPYSPSPIYYYELGR